MSTKHEVIGKYEPATGPWRYDVGVAQFEDGQEYMIEFTHPWYPEEREADYRSVSRWDAEYDYFQYPLTGIVTRDRLRAFASINAPEPSAGGAQS